MLIIVNINVNNLDLDSVIQSLYLINNLQESLINLYIIYVFELVFHSQKFTYNRLLRTGFPNPA